MKNKFYYTFWVLFLSICTFFISCDEASDATDGIKDVAFKATANTTLATEGEVIVYKDSSLNVASRTWTFEGGNITTSTDETVEVVYDQPSAIVDDTPVGYLTTLQVVYEDGSVKENSFKVDIYNHVKANFSADKNAALNGSEISFTNLSEYTESKWEEAREEDSFLWTFPGGIPETSTEENPKVVYPNVGEFPVSLKVFRSAPEDQAIIIKEDFIKIVDVQVIASTANRMVELGSKILLEYDADLNPTDISKFSLVVDGVEAVISSIEVDSENPKAYVVNVETPIVDDQEVTLSYEGGDFAVGGELLGPIVDLGIENTVVNLLKGSNVGFENDAAPSGFPSSGWGNWDEENGRNNPEVYAVVDTEKHSGNNSIEITMDGVSQKWNLNTNGHVEVEEGTYRISVWAKSSASGVKLNFRSVAQGWAHFDGGEVDITTDWQMHSFEFSTVGNTTLSRNYWHQLNASLAASGTKVYLDDISLYRID